MAKYIVAVSASYEELIMMRTTVASPSDSDWAVSGDKLSVAPGRARSATNDKIIVVSSVEDGSDIHVVTQQLSGRVAYHRFDPGTASWTVEDEEVGVPRQEHIDNYTKAADEDNISVGLCLRGDGDVIVLTMYKHAASSDNARLFTREAGIWTNRGVVGSVDTSGLSLCPNPHSSTDRVMWAHHDLDDTTLNIRAITSSNTLDAITSLDTTEDTATQLLGQGVYLSSNEFVIPYIDASDKVSLYKATIAATPSTTQYTDRSANTVYGNGRTTAPFAAFCLAVESDDTVHLLYSDASTQDLFHQPDATNASPPSEVEELDAVTVNRISCRVVNSDGNIYVAYDDAGTLKFLDISLGDVGPAAGLRTLSLTGVGL